MEDALLLAESLGFRVRRPWVMVSVNDQEDLHFRKASFDPTECPADCPRPCETVCPTQAISFSHQASLTGEASTQ
jgi:Fe-S-cluster-containing hydrogenase component 2